ncbi:uncharacterized protein HKW66_Vig0249330 [Vigna angularis]|uniref:Uncharacterized protein n=1 Tax=Phaseolus angularis TaxID=3914 RepID=A0A8T0JQL3_PHAAN|nr:uncharacterized protein HKW66_Vig0249330 [Vigna angularis]
MASSSSRRKWKIARIARNANPIGWIINEDIRRKLFCLRKIKIVVSHRYLKLVTMFYSNLKMSDETFCNKVKGVDMKLIKEIQQKLKKMSGLDGYAVKIDCMSESLKNILGAQVN